MSKVLLFTILARYDLALKTLQLYAILNFGGRPTSTFYYYLQYKSAAQQQNIENINKMARGTAEAGFKLWKSEEK